MDALPYADEDIFHQLIYLDVRHRLELVRQKVFFSFETKNLRSTMTEDRLTGLTMMSIHHAECLVF